MAEGPEIEANELRESLHHLHEEVEEMEAHEAEEKARNAWMRWVALSTAILAVFAAVAALQSGSKVNEAMIAKQEAAIAQAQASDQWAYYQAKGIKLAVSKAVGALLGELKPAAPAGARARSEAARYGKDQQAISVAARKLEAERDRRNRESAEHLETHHWFAYAVTLLQVAIALSAIVALTRRRDIWYISLALGLAGIVLCIRGFVPAAPVEPPAVHAPG